MTSRELTGMKRFTAFVGAMHTKAWFSAPSAIAASAGDLSLLKVLICYPDSGIAKATSKKFANHLWYLSEELAGLALFDASVELELKKLMVSGLKEEGQENPQPRAQVDLTAKEAILTKTVADFVTSASLRIMSAFQVSTNFLKRTQVSGRMTHHSRYHSKSCVELQLSTTLQNVA